MAIRWNNRPALQAQYDRLHAETCPEGQGNEPRHDLRCAEPRRSFWDWVLGRPARTFWDCSYCDLHEERAVEQP